MKSTQRKIRKSWMRRYRRATEGRGYKVHRTSAITVKDPDGNVISNHPGKVYILKDDGRHVLEHKREDGRVKFEVKMA